MDARVDDFLNEINEIVPTKHKELSRSNNKSSCDWEECFDETSGFSYYWNVNTNEVSWEAPSDFKKWKSQLKKPKPPKTIEKHQIYKPESQIIPIMPVSHIPETIIYKIGDTIAKRTDIAEVEKNETAKPKIDFARKVVGTTKKINNKIKLKGHEKLSDDSEEDEKITLISSYGGDTESEDEDSEQNEGYVTESRVIVPARELRPKKYKTSSSNVPLTDQQQKVTGITLLASYGESDDEEDINRDKQDTKLNTTPKISTLFPMPQVIDASQFDSSSNQKPASVKMTGNTLTDEQKVYQRKRRIGLELPTNTATKRIEIKNAEEHLEGSRTGFGFNSSAAEKYSNFKSAGKVMFIKSESDTLLPSNLTSSSSDDAGLLKEKLDFLCEGKQVNVSPVQIMLIQLETLQAAKLAGCLQSTYLQTWLKETNEEISKLEKDSTPEGWRLEWDRRQKRYSYRHLHSGRAQWEYPTDEQSTNEKVEEPLEEDMDICTTPPPPQVHTVAALTPNTTLESQLKALEREILSSDADFTQPSAVEIDDVEMVAPPPPKIGRMSCPVPPPPPILTQADMVTPPLPLMSEESPPPPPPPPPPDEPLPPGVDAPPKNTQKNNVQPENLNTALDSFYSDIAAMESSIIINNVPEDAQKSVISSITNAADVIPVETVKKRKKLKMAQGLSMKKKGVSKLVEKWKNVQKNLD